MSVALVLGGGGLAGIAWELGLLAGLRDRGVDLTGADLVVGTSAGAAVGAQITSSADLDELVARQHEPAEASGEIAAELDLERLTAIFAETWAPDVAADPQAAWAKVGALALDAPTVDEAARRAVIAHRLPDHDWPDRDLRLTAVDAHTGEPRVFDRSSGVELVDAVAASCAVPGVWPCVTIDGRRYLDGGVRSTTNADLAAGAAGVVVVAPMEDPRPGTTAAEVAALEAAGAAVVVVAGGAELAEATGPNPLDPATRGPAADVGRAHAARLDVGPLAALLGR